MALSWQMLRELQPRFKHSIKISHCVNVCIRFRKIATELSFSVVLLSQLRL